MKGKIIGIAVFVLLTIAVGFAAAGAISQAYGGSTALGLTNMAISENDGLALRSEPEKDSGLYQTFTYVCPFH